MAADFLSLGESERPPRARWLAPLSVVLGSLGTLAPVIAVVPVLPPLGLLFLLGWRLTRGDALAVWAAVPLGLFDDMVSGQPPGSAMLLWTLSTLVIDVLDSRLVWRDFWQDWLIAAGATGFCLIAGRFIASPISAHVDTAMLIQLAIAAVLFPAVRRLCAWADSDTVPH
jgi:rod shape-determining protein MreD